MTAADARANRKGSGMRVTRSWKALNTVESPELVLALDFPITGRAEAAFADLTAVARMPAGVWQVVPGPVAPDEPIGLSGYLRPWMDELRSDGRPVRAVMGYCAGAALAAAVVAELAPSQSREPRLVLFDPETVSVATAHAQFGRVVANLASVLEPEEIEVVRAAAEDLAGPGDISVQAFTSGLFSVFRPIGEKALRRAGVEDAYSGELLGLIGSFMSYLTAASRYEPRPAWRRAVAISSATAGSGLSGLPGAPAPLDVVAEEFRFPIEHQDLLRDPSVAQRVAQILEVS